MPLRQDTPFPGSVSSRVKREHGGVSAPFKDSQEAAMRRMVRDAIRKGPFTKGQRDVALAIVNHWFHHNGKRAPIHPGRDKLARKSGVTVKTVSRTLGMLRAAGVLVPVSSLRGGWGSATKYRVNIAALMTLCGCDWLDEFLRGRALNVPQVALKMSRKMGDKMSHGLNDTSGLSDPEGEGDE